MTGTRKLNPLISFLCFLPFFPLVRKHGQHDSCWKISRGGIYDWAGVYIYAYIHTHVYNADLLGHGTAVVDNSVLKQSGQMFAGDLFCLLWSDYASRLRKIHLCLLF
jgi:hypothetical protein